MTQIKTAIRILRAPFFTAVIVPTLLGTAIAWRDGAFQVGYLLLTLLGIVCINAALNLSNDYFDHLSGNDAQNRELTPFSGGSRVIQDGTFPAHRVLITLIVFYLAGIAIGLYLAWSRGWTLLWIGAIGVFIAFFHNAPPFKLYYLAPGVGELAAGVGCGPLIVLGAYYVQAQRLSTEAFWASLPVGLLTAAVLYINEFPDYVADRAVGKRTLVGALGRARAVWGYAALLAAVYVVIAVGVATQALPLPTLLAFLSIPVAYRGVRDAMRYHSDTPRLIPTNAATILLSMTTGLLLCMAYVVAGFV